MVRDWIKKEPITTWDAFKELRVTRLSEYIRQLRVEGMNIESIPQHSVNRYGKKIGYVKYVLRPKMTLF